MKTTILKHVCLALAVLVLVLAGVTAVRAIPVDLNPTVDGQIIRGTFDFSFTAADFGNRASTRPFEITADGRIVDWDGGFELSNECRIGGSATWPAEGPFFMLIGFSVWKRDSYIAPFERGLTIIAAGLEDPDGNIIQEGIPASRSWSTDYIQSSIYRLQWDLTEGLGPARGVLRLSPTTCGRAGPLRPSWACWLWCIGVYFAWLKPQQTPTLAPRLSSSPSPSADWQPSVASAHVSLQTGVALDGPEARVWSSLTQSQFPA
jgi:hypothetical protein